MNLDLSKVYLGSMCIVHSCTHWLRPRKLSPPAFGLICEGAIGQPRKTTSLCDPLCNTEYSIISNSQLVQVRLLFSKICSTYIESKKLLLFLVSDLFYVLYLSVHRSPLPTPSQSPYPKSYKQNKQYKHYREQVYCSISTEKDMVSTAHV
jgi:hypothetical protein